MRAKNKKPKNRYGASSVFLGIILSAVILIECTFLTFVWELDYMTKVNSAAEAQIESIMCEYNRQLFDVYGVYAFTKDAVDDDIYRKALLACGYEEGPVLDLGGYKQIDRKAMRDAINMYYSYRATGITICQIADVFSEMIGELVNTGVLKSIKEYTSSPAAGFVSDIISGSEKLTEWIEKAGEALKIDDIDSKLGIFESVKKSLKGNDNDLKDLSINISISDMKPAIKLIDSLMELHETQAKTSCKLLTHLNAANYFSYNFDCFLKQDIDYSINGTAFSNIHSKNKDDAEYILTGLTGNASIAAVNYLLLAVLTGKNFLKDYLDKDFRSKVDVVSQILSAIIAVISEGSVEIDYRIITVALIFLIATIQGGKDINTLRKGERVTLAETKDKTIATAGYRDFLYLFMLAQSDDRMIDRSLNILKRDYGDLYTGLTAKADAGLKKIEIKRSYVLYG